VETRNGKAELPAKIGKIEKGQVFIPFHWGGHNQGGHDHMNGRAVAANELTVPSWDFISKQPIFKVGRAAVTFQKRLLTSRRLLVSS
jgi:ferredoxin-nitrate reductase